MRLIIVTISYAFFSGVVKSILKLVASITNQFNFFRARVTILLVITARNKYYFAALTRLRFKVYQRFVISGYIVI
jgi:hypothetical protein